MKNFIITMKITLVFFPLTPLSLALSALHRYN